MSTIAKIFVVINLVLAVVFATFTVALFSKRVAYYDDQVKEVKKLTDQLKVVNDNLTAMTKDRDDKEKLRQAAVDKATNFKGQFEQAQKDRDQARIEKAAADSNAKVANESVTFLTQQSDKQRQELENTRKIVVALKERETVLRANEAELKKDRDDLKNQINLARRDLQDLHRDRRRMAEELANAEYILGRLVQDGVDIAKYGSVSPVPDVRTKVVDVRPASGYVALGAGKSSGIKEGHVFLIHRDKEYLGKVRVTTVWDNFSGGTVVERKKPIQAGDDAMTDTAPSL